MLYDIAFEDFATSATGDTYKTAVACHATNTLGHRYKLREVDVQAADDTPLDKNLAVQIKKVLDVSAGSAGTPGTTIAAADLSKRDTLQIDAPFGAGIEYPTTPPSSYKTEAIKQWEFNAHGGLIYGWSFADAPVCNRDELLGVLVAPRAAGAIQTSGGMTIETF